MRAGDHLPRNGNRPAVGVEIEAICELPASMDAGAWVDGAEEVPVRALDGREDRARPLGGLRRRQIAWPARRRVDGVRTMTVTANPAAAGNHSSAATSNAATEVWRSGARRHRDEVRIR